MVKSRGAPRLVEQSVHLLLHDHLLLLRVRRALLCPSAPPAGNNGASPRRLPSRCRDARVPAVSARRDPPLTPRSRRAAPLDGCPLPPPPARRTRACSSCAASGFPRPSSRPCSAPSANSGTCASSRTRASRTSPSPPPRTRRPRSSASRSSARARAIRAASRRAESSSEDASASSASCSPPTPTPSPTKTDPETDRDPPSRPARRPRAASPRTRSYPRTRGTRPAPRPGGAIRPRATARGGEGKGNAREEKPGPPRREERGASAGVSRRRPGRRPAQIATLRRVPEGGLPGPTQGRLPGPYTRRGRGEGEGDGRGRRGGREPLGEQPLGDRRRLGDDGRTRRRRRYGRSRRRRR